MPRQNRVTPFSSIEANPARGLFTGNRGILHDDSGQMVSTRWRHPHWIICELQYKDWRRPIAAPGHWTELFFLDEAVALAAGHRPCAFCRRPAYLEYRQAANLPPSAKAIDALLHKQRLEIIQHRQYQSLPLRQVPAGAFFLAPDDPQVALLQGPAKPLRWTHDGYQSHPPIQAGTSVALLTPQASLDALRGGYRPRLHPSAL